MVDPFTIMALAQAVPAVAQGVQGMVQNRKSNKLSEGLEDPNMPIPPAAKEALDIARANASSRYMSGQLANQAKLDSQLANIMGSITQNSRSPQDAIAALTMLGAQGQQQQLGLGADAARDYERRQADLRGELHNMQGWENKQWETNVMEPFLRDAAAASAMKNAGINNMYQGLKGAAGAAGTYGMGKYIDGLKTKDVTTTPAANTTPTESVKTPSYSGPNGTQIDPKIIEFLQNGAGIGNTSMFTPSRNAAEGLNYMTSIPLSPSPSLMQTNPLMNQITGMSPDQIAQLMGMLNLIGK